MGAKPDCSRPETKAGRDGWIDLFACGDQLNSRDSQIGGEKCSIGVAGQGRGLQTRLAISELYVV